MSTLLNIHACIFCIIHITYNLHDVNYSYSISMLLLTDIIKTLRNKVKSTGAWLLNNLSEKLLVLFNIGKEKIIT